MAAFEVTAEGREAGLYAAVEWPFVNHTFRGTGITVFLQNGARSKLPRIWRIIPTPRTTKLYDRRKDLATLTEIEPRIAFE